MKTIISFSVLISLVFLLSCNDNPNAGEMKQVRLSSKLDTVVFAVDTFQHAFGKYGSGEELSVIEQPLHASLFRISDRHENGQVLEYAPQPGFLGTDSLVVLSKRIINEPEPTVKTDSLTMVIHVLKDQIHQEVIGKWILWMTCGGFTGRCDSVKPADVSQIEFGYDMDFTESKSGIISKRTSYYLRDSICHYQTADVTRHYIYVKENLDGRNYTSIYEYDSSTPSVCKLVGTVTYAYIRVQE